MAPAAACRLMYLGAQPASMGRFDCWQSCLRNSSHLAARCQSLADAAAKVGREPSPHILPLRIVPPGQ